MIDGKSLRALGRALTPKTPERAVFLAASAALVVGGVKKSRKIETAAKPLVMLSIGAGLWRTRGERDSVDNALLGIAAAGSFAGDWLMLEEEFAEDDAASDRWIQRGASAFAVNHLAMIAVAVRHGARPPVTEFLIRSVGLVEGLLVLRATRPHLLLGLGAYSKLLAAMSAVMASPQLEDDGLELGGLSFLASDATLLHRRSFLAAEGPRAAAEAVVLTTYTAAQALLFDGLARIARR